MLEEKEVKIEFVDPRTGEIKNLLQTIKTRSDCPFRSLTDLKERQLGEMYDPESSLVDKTGYEPLMKIIEKCTVRQGKKTVIIPGALPHKPGSYDIQDITKVNSDDAFCQADPTLDPSFDLADSTAIMDNAEALLKEEALKQSKSATKVEVEQSETQPEVASFDEQKAKIDA